MGNPDYEKLIKVLRAERQDGSLDHKVIGGLEGFLAGWLGQARTGACTPEQSATLNVIGTALQGYGDKSVAERSAALDQAMQAALGNGYAEVASATDTMGAGRRETRGASRSGQPDIYLTSPLSELPGIGTVQARRLNHLNLQTVQDLLYFLPRRYDDFSHLKKIQELQYGEEITIVGIVREARNQQTRGGMQLTRTVISDDTGMIEAVWFNQPYLLRQMPIGRRLVLSGRVDQYLGRLTLQSPQWEPWKPDLVHTGRLVPVYPLTEGLSARRVRTLVKSALDRLAPSVADPIPDELRKTHQLADLPTALRQVHFPDNEQTLAQARHRLCFEEFLYIQLGVIKQRALWQTQQGRPLQIHQPMISAFTSSLPFSLTAAQQRALQEIFTDLQRSQPMSRLLQGDVGSGKTVVALGAMLAAVSNGMQAAIMAPTEILAEQHALTLTALVQGLDAAAQRAPEVHQAGIPRIRVGLLKGSMIPAEKQEQRRAVAAGEVDILVGTHALIQEAVTFRDLGLVVVDEQHRFGVAQRAALRQKGYNPHILVMTATPIPRTLALTIHGDLDISTIDELPPHRQKIATQWLKPVEREHAYEFIRSQVQQGRQAFIICPLIEESEHIEARAATNEYRRLQTEVFPDMRLALLHGRLANAEKDDIMRRFRERESDILVTTPVVEVGIDVPNATVMLVDGADRFGLAQLHQFRGRVGRGPDQSYCLLLAESPSADATQRLKIIETTQDGFALAEEDLKLRGPGEFFGTRQSGLPDLKVAQLGDLRVLEEARRAAAALFRSDPGLSQPEHQFLARRVEDFWGQYSDLS